MSQTKRMLEKEEQKQEEALKIAIAAGVVIECEFHGYTMNGNNDAESAYTLGSYKFKNESEIKDIFENHKAMMSMIKMAVENNAANECYACAKIREE